jgi:hypothetical protein
VCRKLRYLKERELVYLSGSFLCAARDALAVPRAARHYYGLDLDLAARAEMSATNRNSSTVTGQSTSPGEDSTGAGAEQELGFDPQSKAELAQGEYKGAREVLARHVHTAEPRGGPGGWLLRTQRTTQPSWMCSFDDI